MLNLFSNIFGSSNDRILKKMMVQVNAANQLEEELKFTFNFTIGTMIE